MTRRLNEETERRRPNRKEEREEERRRLSNKVGPCLAGVSWNGIEELDRGVGGTRSGVENGAQSRMINSANPSLALSLPNVGAAACLSQSKALLHQQKHISVRADDRHLTCFSRLEEEGREGDGAGARARTAMDVLQKPRRRRYVFALAT